MKKRHSIPILLLIMMVGCGSLVALLAPMPKISDTQKKLLSLLPKRLVVAHRGTTFWAPEETEAAMRWARNQGADYLEFDLQRTKDGYLVALHDNNLMRTTDIETKYPERKTQPLSAFTYEELMTLDAGSWFNESNIDRARPTFSGLDLLTLEDVIQIAEGKRIKRGQDGKRIFEIENGEMSSVFEPDPFDNGNRPGIYPETKLPRQFPGIEDDLKRELTRLKWYGNKKTIPVSWNKVGVANTAVRVILQTFSKESLQNLTTTFGQTIPICFLLWQGTEPDDIPNDSLSTYKAWITFAVKNGASIIGPSVGGEPNHYPDLLSVEKAAIIKETGACIHAYSFDTKSQIKRYSPLVNGVFTNKTEEALALYKLQKKIDENSPSHALHTLKNLGY